MHNRISSLSPNDNGENNSGEIHVFGSVTRQQYPEFNKNKQRTRSDSESNCNCKLSLLLFSLLEDRGKKRSVGPCCVASPPLSLSPHTNGDGVSSCYFVTSFLLSGCITLIYLSAETVEREAEAEAGRERRGWVIRKEKRGTQRRPQDSEKRGKRPWKKEGKWPVNRYIR